MDKKTRSSKFINVLIVIVSIAIIAVLSMFFLDTTGKINQGYFRINDMVMVSTVDVVDKNKEQAQEVKEGVPTTDQVQNQPINSLADLTLDITQKNEISFLVAKSGGVEPTKIYIDNIEIKYPVLTEGMYIYQDTNNKTNMSTGNIKLDIVKEDKEGQFLIKLNIDNVNCVKNATIPETESSTVLFDGTILNLLNVKLTDLQFDISFNLNIVDSTGKLNVCKAKLNLPNELLITNGISIINRNTGNFPFSVK